MSLYVDVVEETDFHRAWVSAVQMVLMSGADLVIGGAEERKPIKDSCMLITLEGKAIKQVERRELHPQFPTKKKHLDKYCEEYTRNFVDVYRKDESKEKFAYLYGDRLMYYKHPVYISIDQLKMMMNGLYSQMRRNITSNRMQAITWYVHDDNEGSSPPCLQRIQMRYIPEGKVDVHLTWRSRDLYAAWQSNVVCLIDMLNREVIRPNECEIIRIVDFSDSLHIYRTDIVEAKKVRFMEAL